MLLTVQQLSHYAWMSQASYLDFAGLSPNDADSLEDKLKESSINRDKEFTLKQASLFTGSNTDDVADDGFSFINHQANTDSGFSATVFAKSADLFPPKY